jgi:IMP dehydrogenase
MATVSQLLDSKTLRSVWSIDAAASVYDAISLMARRQVGALIVFRNARIVGIVTERDYARKIALLDRSSRDTLVQEIMSTAIHCVRADQTTEACIALMTEHRIRYLPVVASGRVIGMVSIGDLIQNLFAEQEQTIQQLEHYIHGNTPYSGQSALKRHRGTSLAGLKLDS